MEDSSRNRRWKLKNQETTGEENRGELQEWETKIQKPHEIMWLLMFSSISIKLGELFYEEISGFEKRESNF